MEPKLKELKDRLIEINDVQSAGALLYWDHSTYMPPGGAEARGRQMGTLTRIAHEKFIDPAVGKLLDDLKGYEASLGYDSDEASLIRVTRREYDRAVKVPPAFQAEFSNLRSATYDVWAKARPENNFKLVQPYLEKVLDMSRRLADFFPGYEHIADPLIDFVDYGMKTSVLRTLFNDLRGKLVPIVQALCERKPADDSCLHQHFPEDNQLAFGMAVIKQLGYDLSRGRQDKTHHPFMTKFSLGDVRITTRVSEEYFPECLFSTIHETGHALYEQGIPMEFEATPLAEGASMGVHESQSRLWENLVGRSIHFWRHFYTKLQAVFPDQLNAVPLETFYRAINKVERSLVRTGADEVTYNLHVMIRFELELLLLEGGLEIRDLPEAWRERYRSDIGAVPPDDKDGCMQDMHWYSGLVGGMFQCYTLGNILSAQFFEAAVCAHPEIPARIEAGSFETLHQWLKENIHRHGAKFTAAELVSRVTGQPLSIDPYIRYLRTKYGQLYGL
jgi:carboxypeptidase Taq